MNGSTAIGLALIVVGAADLVIGLMIVAPRAPERARPALRLAFGLGAILMIAAGGLFVAGVLGGGG